MSGDHGGVYQHWQWGPWWVVMGLIGVLTLGGAAWEWDEPGARIVLGCLSVMFWVLAACFAYLRVEDQGDALGVSFGPIRLFRRRIPYRAIEGVAEDRTTFLEGWGIHLSLRGGWVWNIWGWDCVRIELTQGRRLWIGTDDAENLNRFLMSKLGNGEHVEGVKRSSRGVNRSA